MRLVKSIINNNNKLIGFMVEGTEKEFGNPNKVGVTYKHAMIEELGRIKFSNDQAHIDKGDITEKNNFYINELPMLLYTEKGMKEVDNSIELTHALMNGTLVAGYRVLLGGHQEHNYRYNDIIKMTKWFKPVNFKVGEKDGVKFITEVRYGGDLDKLPVIVVGGKSNDRPKDKDASSSISDTAKTNIKEQTNISKEENENIQQSVEEEVVNERELEPNNKDLLGLIEIVKEHFGVVFRPGNYGYSKSTGSNQVCTEQFINSGVGEVSAPFFSFPERSLNANMIFKTIGTVKINSNNRGEDVFTYVNRAKNVVLNGKVKMDKLIVGINNAGVDRVLEDYGKDIVVGELHDSNIINAIINIANLQKNNENYKIKSGELRFLEIDISKLPVMTKYKAKQIISDNKHIKEMVESLQYRKAQMKYLRGLEKELEAIAEDKGIRLGDGYLEGPYANEDKQFITQLLKAGISLKTGEFTEVHYEKDETYIKEIGKSTEIEVLYKMNGLNLNALSFDSIRYKVQHPLMNDDLMDLVDVLEVIGDVQIKYEATMRFKKQLNSLIDLIKEELWLNKMAMYVLGDCKALKLNSIKDWVKVKGSNKGATIECTGKGAENLQLFIKGLGVC